MTELRIKSQSKQLQSARGHPMPRRSTPEKSVTLQNHRLGWDATRLIARAAAEEAPTSSPRRNRSNDSNETTTSDPAKWFSQSNLNASTYAGGAMDVDSPFFQRESYSSNEDNNDVAPFVFAQRASHKALLQPTVAHSSSTDDFRSVIDDLTIENKRLKEELKRYRQLGPETLKKDKLFEIKVHGLPKRKKRELEATLRDFAASLPASSAAPSSTQRRTQARHGKPAYYSGESMSKHASSSSSRSRPVDSAYASMSADASSNAPTSKGNLYSAARAKSLSELKAEKSMTDTPDGLFPHHMIMTDKERKKLVVRRLEQLFTGKLSERSPERNQSDLDVPVQDDGIKGQRVTLPLLDPEAAREARIQHTDPPHKERRSRDLPTNSHDGQTEFGENGVGDGSGSGSGSGRSGPLDNSPSTVPPPEQRPTRPRDLDPNRAQVPSDNMDYIRHLGLVPPEFLVNERVSYHDVSPDADGWVFLNLLCNMAQLHMFNVTPSFIRSAVSEKSAKFQLSADGRKIRWRGGSDGTKFSSDSSGDNSHKSPSTDDTDDSLESKDRNKKQKLADGKAGKAPDFGGQASYSSESFHYKPLFLHHTTSTDTSQGEESESQLSFVEEPNQAGHSIWNYSGSGASQRKKRRRDGAIIYYTGAPFCTDLSGDPGDSSPMSYLISATQEAGVTDVRPEAARTSSESTLSFRPLSQAHPQAISSAWASVQDTSIGPDPVDEDEDDDMSLTDGDIDFPWCDEPEKLNHQSVEPTLEPCGLGGVLPDDHFAVLVTTRRTIRAHDNMRQRSTSEDTTDAISGQLASMSTASIASPRAAGAAHIKVEYMSGQIRRLQPMPLPPPTMFFAPFSTESSLETDADSSDVSGEEESYQALRSRAQINALNAHNTYPDNTDLSSNDEEDEIDEREDMNPPPPALSQLRRHDRPTLVHRVTSGSTKGRIETGSSVATAGGLESGYNSSMEYVNN